MLAKRDGSVFLHHLTPLTLHTTRLPTVKVVAIQVIIQRLSRSSIAKHRMLTPMH